MSQRGDTAFDVGGGACLLGVGGGWEDHIGEARRVGDERVDRNDASSAGESTASKIGVGHIGNGIGTNQDETLDLASGRRIENAGAVEAALAATHTDADCADDIAATKRWQHLCLGQCSRQSE